MRGQLALAGGESEGLYLSTELRQVVLAARGFDVARHIRTQPWGEDCYIVALTGWGQERDRARAREAGFDAHLVKPVEPGVLSRLLANGVRSAKSGVKDRAEKP